MKDLKQFEIELFKLSLGQHEFDFDIDDDFFKHFETSLISKGKLKAKLVLNRTETLIRAELDIEGAVEMICDRSLRTFDEEVNVSHKLMVKYGEEFDDSEDEIIIVNRDMPVWNVSNLIYETVTLQIPYKKIHPDLREEEEEFLDLGPEFEFLNQAEPEVELIYTTADEDENEEESADQKEKEEDIDPRWQALKNLQRSSKKK